ncbi:MAG: OPT family oligopeptide transporter [Roseburia sp.]
MKQEKDFKPYISADKKMPELTGTSIITGILLALIFGGANAYLGLRVGMTVSASIPAAVISMGVIRVLLRRESILENNMVQTIGSAGESVAAGAIFTLPALFMWAAEEGEASPSLLEITLITLIGGIIGVLFMIPLRNALIVKEHNAIPYPEGKACAEVLMAGEKGGKKAGIVFAGLGVSAGYKFLADGIKIFPSEVDYRIKGYKGAGFGADVLPALLGVGYICGAKVSSYLLAGGMTAWFVIMPLIVLFGGNAVLYPADVSVAEVFAESGTWGIWRTYVRYIGAGAVAAGGIISLIKSLPLILHTFRQAISGFGEKKVGEENRLNQDISMKIVWIGILIMALVMWLIPVVPVNFWGALIIIIFGFFFSTVSSRMVGLVGSSNNPVSGMTIATLLIATSILKAIGNTGMGGMVAAITIGSVICIISALAGDTSQDLKTGYLIGATPKKQQIGELIGVVTASLAIGGVLYLLNVAWGYGSAELPAPQATLMKMVVEGVMGGNLPWNLVFIGVFLAVIVEILQIPSLPFAVGLYLPIHLSVPMMAGGLVRLAVDRKKGNTERGILYASGLIAGEGIIGILLAVFTIITINGKSISDWLNFSERMNLGNAGGLVAFALLIVTLCMAVQSGKEEN